ncbi:hypothetical protein MRB53_009632 [Persea americana]|uniref:Uncharacterized protein n=1 Tax=Persea americana TaxID=3435 RepID=A0ACC2LPR7_PERAE|nr:hypothetical protein MRB53_009632 [Persea americana]
MLISGFVKTLMGTLSSLLQQEFGIAWGRKKELEKLESTLTTIQTVLKDAEAKKGKNEELKNWLRKLKDAAYEADDMIDEFKIEALQWKAAGTLKKVHKFFSRSNALAFSIEMGHKIQEIRDKLDAIAAERSKFHLRDEVGGNRIENEERLVTDSFIIESEIYGREDEKEVIVKSLVSNMSEPGNVSILPIVGMGGLGKTTLAQLAYNDERIMNHFDQRIWICVSDSFKLRRLMDAIIESVCDQVSGYVELDPLQRRLRETLCGKRFLLVLDDVWSEDQDKWDRLKSMLTCGGKGSTIIVTTRIEKVARMTGTLPTFYLACLSDDDCWSLFKRRAFELGRREEHPNLVAIGKEIVKKCGGVPLAVKALGSMLCYKSEERDWLYVKDSEIWELSDDDNAILPALRLSYDHLPSHSRQCFAYCAIFPKDYEIKKETLIHHWMGNGFIPSKRMMVLEDVGHEIFNDLVCRSFFQNIREDEDGNITKCKMHDLVHDLAQSVMVDDSAILIFGKEERIPEKIRHFSYDRKSTIPMSLYDSPTLWTFLALHDYQSEIIAVSHHMSKFKRLRVLELTHARVGNLSPLIGNLKHLRLPKKMRKMNNLTHLDNAHNTSLNCMPRRMGQLTQLQTLKLFIVGKKNGYRIVEYKMQENLDEVLEGLRPHPNLKQLLINNYHGLVFPSWMRDTTLQNLVRLSLINCKRSENLPPLGKLSSLKNLVIHEKDAIKFIGTGFYGDDETMKAFPSLKELEFVDMPNWEEWSRSEGRELFPQL